MKHSKHQARLRLSTAVALALTTVPSAHASAVSGQGTWESTLQARDINHDGTIDAYYDTSSNLTWLADANNIKTSGFPIPYPNAPDGFFINAQGAANSVVVNDWLQTLNAGDVSGWRLPTLTNGPLDCINGNGHNECRGNVAPGTSELANLFTVTLGNPSGQMTNTGPFQNVQSGPYWLGATYYAGGGEGTVVWDYNPATGLHDCLVVQGANAQAFAWAVRTGDMLSAVPEPSTISLAVLGLAAIGWSRRRKPG